MTPLLMSVLLFTPGWVSTSTEDHSDEHQAICEGHEGGRSWRHFLETTCLADLTLRGIVKTQKGYKALLEREGAQPQFATTTFTAEVGALLYDGLVVAIDESSISIRQTIGMPARSWQASGADERQTRLVTRRLESDSKRQRH